MKNQMLNVLLKDDLRLDGNIEGTRNDGYKGTGMVHLVATKPFRKEKPYLQTNFKITGLAEALNVNRSVMSAFINRNYGVNFSRFLNR